MPLDRLRSGGLVEVELSGPEDALARYEASLRGLLDREGVRVDAWSRLAGGGAVVRARFTIYPPGSR
ncbi:MAG: hypothetical protein H6708_22185 [Kofleriaceae bacterium]|nr:hypothetical protein [Kofleriaceae bacterium]